jgi:hypothetical protein
MTAFINQFWPAIAWFIALFFIWVLFSGSKRRENRRLRCIKHVPERRTINFDYQSIKDRL